MNKSRKYNAETEARQIAEEDAQAQSRARQQAEEQAKVEIERIVQQYTDQVQTIKTESAQALTEQEDRLKGETSERKDQSISTQFCTSQRARTGSETI